MLGLHSELDEVLDELNWKSHRNVPGTIIRQNLLEECVDVFKFALSLFTTWGFTPEEVGDEFMRKSAVVEQRYAQELMLPEDGRIVGVDIDGVLAEYAEAFCDWVWLKHMAVGAGAITPRHPDVNTLNLAEVLGLSGAEYIQLKREWRESGMKAHLPVVEGAKEFLSTLKEAGYTIVLLSARPYKEHKRIFSDTMEWLNTNGLEHDAILFDEHKNERLLREYGAERIEFFVEDNLEQANAIASCGVNVYLLDKPYNRGLTASGVVRIDDLRWLP